jgi:hypothetical protein
MTTSPAVGARVSVEARALFPKSNKPLEGVVLGQLDTHGFLLIDFGSSFEGHNGHPQSIGKMARGSFGETNTCWFVMPTYVTELPDTIATAAPAHAKQQTDRILKHLLAGNSISQLEAFGVFRIFRLAARIHDLRAKGHKIKTTMKADAEGKPYAEYALVSRNLRAA